MSVGFSLSRALVLEEVTRQPDNAGGYTESWVALGTLFADMRAGTGRERGFDAVTVSYVPYRIVVRAAPEGAVSRPKAGQRFREGERLFRIEAVADHNRDGLYLECFTKEEVLS
jgi:head-tail adaptor